MGRLYGRCGEAVWRVWEDCLEGVGRLLEGVRRLMESVERLSVGVWRLSGGCGDVV